MDNKLTEQVTRENMAEYSIYVAQNRAVPNVIDGLKPVQRRCITSADDLNLRSSGRYLKAAKIEGTVMGDYHPHGGASLSGLVQPFRIRYPLMVGQGNWGCPDDPGSVAASRYIEAKLSKFCEDIYLSSRDHADKEPNYDGRLMEVVKYYPPVPGVMLTSSEGIAVGLTTKIPPYEIGSICRSLKSYIEKDDTYLDIVPDTCEKSVMISTMDDVRLFNKTGYGTFRYRAATHREIEKKGVHCLVIDAFPPYFSRKRLENNTILEYVDSGDLTLTNESSTDIRYVFRSKRSDILDSIESILESSVTYKCIAENNGVVHQYTLSEIYDEFIEARLRYLERKYTDLFSKSKVELDYYNYLYYLKKHPNIIRSLIDISELEAIELLKNRLSCEDDTIINRILRSSIRSLLRDNTEEILGKIESYKKDIKEYQTYLSDLMSKLISDLNDVESKYGGEPNCRMVSTITTDEKEDINVEYYSVEKNGFLSKINKSTAASVNSRYFILTTKTGFLVCDRETLENRYPDTIMKGLPLSIYGVDDISKIKCKINGKIYYLDTWSIRKRKSSEIEGEVLL